MTIGGPSLVVPRWFYKLSSALLESDTLLFFGTSLRYERAMGWGLVEA